MDLEWVMLCRYNVFCLVNIKSNQTKTTLKYIFVLLNIFVFPSTAKGEEPVEIDRVRTGTEYNEESTLHVYCIERTDGFLRVLFTKDGKNLLSRNDSRVDITVKKKTMQESLYMLTVKNLTLNDTGNYGCTSELNYPKILSSINITIKCK